MVKLTPKQRELLTWVYRYGEVSTDAFNPRTVRSLAEKGIVIETSRRTVVLCGEIQPQEDLINESEFAMCPRCGQYRMFANSKQLAECEVCGRVVMLK